MKTTTIVTTIIIKTGAASSNSSDVGTVGGGGGTAPPPLPPPALPNTGPEFPVSRDHPPISSNPGCNDETQIKCGKSQENNDLRSW